MFVILGVVVVACGGPAQPAGNAGETTASAIGDVPEQQRQFVEDGVVTGSEYKAAMQNAAACVSDRGWSAYLEDGAGGQLQLGVTFESPVSEDDGDRLDSDVFECLGVYSDATEQLYLASQGSSGAERDQELMDLVDCLMRAGVEAANVDMQESDFIDAIVSSLSGEEQAAGFACMDAHTGFGGDAT